MRITEQAEQGRLARSGQFRCVGYEGAARVLRLPFRHEITAIGAPTAGNGIGQEVAATAAYRHFDAIARLRAKTRVQMLCKSHELSGDIDAAPATRRFGQVAVVFPVAIDRAGIGRPRSGVGQPRSADNARGFARELRDLQQRQQFISGLAAAVTAGCVLVHAKHPDIGFHTGHDGAHGAGGIRGLGVHVVGFDQPRNGKPLKTQRIFLAAATGPLPRENSRGGYGGDTHAVTEKQDDVPGLRVAGGSSDPPMRLSIPVVLPLMRGDRRAAHGASRSGAPGACRGIAGIDSGDVYAAGQKQAAGDSVAMHGFCPRALLSSGTIVFGHCGRLSVPRLHDKYHERWAYR